jgi:LuxR family maltose regulon positive regulatory protein
MKSILLATKLYRPPIPPKLVRRPRLVQRLNEGLELGRQITLISAPAGFGKSSCAAEWVSGLDLPVAWLSLDRLDDDPVRFFTYLVAALQQVDETLCQAVEKVLQSGQIPPIEIMSMTLGNELLSVPGRFVLILDDFQVIQDRFILEVLEKLVTNPPPPLHLVLLTREDPSLPLARLRANNQLTEIRAEDLRFTLSEAGRFLAEVIGLSLSPADVATLEDKTEGWIAGLQLAGFSVRGRADPSGFITGLSGSHRHILSYLTEEVLSQQPEEIQHFLLQTSILDRLTGDLCNAVTGRTDGRVLLERLFAANLFLIPLDDEQQWYRYHHLFADLLRNLQSAFEKAHVAGLHRRASRWYAQAGMASEAIQHALDAADYAMALHLIEPQATGMMVQGYAKTVQSWLNAIPPELRLHSPRTSMAFVWMHLMRGTFAQAAPYLEQLQAWFASPQPEEEPDPSLKAEWLALQASLLVAQGKATEGLMLATQALEIAPAEDGVVRSLACNGLAGAHLQMGNYASAVEAYQAAILHSRAAADFVSEMLSSSLLAQMTIRHGQLHLAFETASQAIERVEHSEVVPPASAIVYGALGQVHYQWNQLEQARRHLLRAIQLCALGGYADGEIYCRALFARLLQAEGNLEASSQEIQEALELMQSEAPVWVRAEVVSQQVRLYCAQDRLAAAEVALKQQGFPFEDKLPISGFAPEQNITHEVGLLYNSALRVLLHQVQVERETTNLKRGIDLADRLIGGALAGQYIFAALETLLLRAQMVAVLGDHRASRADCARALELAEPEGFINIFVEEGLPIAEALAFLHKHNLLGAVQPAYVGNILAAFSRVQSQDSARGEQPAADWPPGNEPLSRRELEILRLIAEGCSNQEIAERLVLSLNTVKKHTSNIFTKLGVNSRTQAIARSHQLKLL